MAASDPYRSTELEKLEIAARAAIEHQAGHEYTDAEWTRYRTRLLEFVNTLRKWDQQVKMEGPEQRVNEARLEVRILE